jgi:hypothetical protein
LGLGIRSRKRRREDARIHHPVELDIQPRLCRVYNENMRHIGHARVVEREVHRVGVAADRVDELTDRATVEVEEAAAGHAEVDVDGAAWGWVACEYDVGMYLEERRAHQ